MSYTTHGKYYKLKFSVDIVMHTDYVPRSLRFPMLARGCPYVHSDLKKRTRCLPFSCNLWLSPTLTEEDWVWDTLQAAVWLGMVWFYLDWELVHVLQILMRFICSQQRVFSNNLCGGEEYCVSIVISARKSLSKKITY